MKRKVNMQKIATWLMALFMMVLLSAMFWYSIIGQMPSP